MFYCPLCVSMYRIIIISVLYIELSLVIRSLLLNLILFFFFTKYQWYVHTYVPVITHFNGWTDFSLD